MWGCTKALCETGKAFYRCPLCRVRVHLVRQEHYDLMHSFCPTKECIKESCCDGPRFQWKLMPCDKGCFQCKEASLQISRIVPASDTESEEPVGHCDHCGDIVYDDGFDMGPEGEMWCNACARPCVTCGHGVLDDEQHHCRATPGALYVYCYRCAEAHKAVCNGCGERCSARSASSSIPAQNTDERITNNMAIAPEPLEEFAEK